MSAMSMPGMDAHINRGGPMFAANDRDLEAIVKELAAMTPHQLVDSYIEHHSESDLRDLLAVDSTLPERIDQRRIQQAHDDFATNSLRAY